MAEKLYRIGEAANLLDVKTSVLRFWEDCFTQLTPIRTKKGQRLYRERDLVVLRQIQHLLYERGLTIEGARRALAQEFVPQQGVPFAFLAPEIQEQSPVAVGKADANGVSCHIIAELQCLRDMLS